MEKTAVFNIRLNIELRKLKVARVIKPTLHAGNKTIATIFGSRKSYLPRPESETATSEDLLLYITISHSEPLVQQI